jgi:predicted ester cyclase
MAVSHFRMCDDNIVEDITVFDELAIMRQVAGGLGATGVAR